MLVLYTYPQSVPQLLRPPTHTQCGILVYLHGSALIDIHKRQYPLPAVMDYLKPSMTNTSLANCRVFLPATDTLLDFVRRHGAHHGLARLNI